MVDSRLSLMCLVKRCMAMLSGNHMLYFVVSLEETAVLRCCVLRDIDIQGSASGRSWFPDCISDWNKKGYYNCANSCCWQSANCWLFESHMV